MARPKKIEYEYHEKKGLYRKRVKDASGKYCDITAKSPEKLEEKIAAFERRQVLSETGKKNMFFNDYAQNWLDLNRANLSFGGFTDYQSVINRHIKPLMSGKRMLQIKPNDIKEVMAGVADKSESVYERTYMLMNQILTSACKNKDIPENPCPAFQRGGIPPKERVPLTDLQAKTLLDAVAGTKAFIFCMIGLYAGLRREEILGLQWECVFLDPPARIEVKRALRFVHNQPVVSEKLKTKASKRVVPIPPILVSCLSSHKAKSQSMYVIANNSEGPLTQSQFKSLWNSVVCRSAKEHTYRNYSNGEMKKITVKGELGKKVKGHSFYYSIDFDVTPHVLRHTYITNLLLKGVDIKTVQYLAGHEKAKITLDIYAHLTYNRPEEISQKLAKAFGDSYIMEE